MNGPDESPGERPGGGPDERQDERQDDGAAPPAAAPPEPDEPRVDEGGGAVVPDGDPASGMAQRPGPERPARERSADDTDTGWGEVPRPDGDHDSWLREQRPPHWD